MTDEDTRMDLIAEVMNYWGLDSNEWEALPKHFQDNLLREWQGQELVYPE